MRPLETIGGKFALGLSRAVEVMCFDVDSTERSERHEKTIPFVGVAG